jgi:hypothetical protein
VYEPCLKLYAKAVKYKANVVQSTPSLSLQATGTQDQYAVPWTNGLALSPLITLETAQQGRSLLLSDEKKVTF